MAFWPLGKRFVPVALAVEFFHNLFEICNFLEVIFKLRKSNHYFDTFEIASRFWGDCGFSRMMCLDLWRVDASYPRPKVRVSADLAASSVGWASCLSERGIAGSPGQRHNADDAFTDS